MIKDGQFYKKKEGMKRMSKKILVTGCNGQLGRAINKEYAGSDVTFINTDVAEGEGVTALDITKIEQVLSLVRAEQPEVIIWPVVFLIYLFVFIVFVIINSKSRFRGTQFIRYIDILLEMIVFIKIISSLLQTGIILYTLYYNSVNILY